MLKIEELVVNQVINKFLELPVKVFTVESTYDDSLFFTIFINEKNIYLEYYLSDKYVVLCVFEDKNKIYGIDGELDEVINKFKENYNF